MGKIKTGKKMVICFKKDFKRWIAIGKELYATESNFEFSPEIKTILQFDVDWQKYSWQKFPQIVKGDKISVPKFAIDDIEYVQTMIASGYFEEVKPTAEIADGDILYRLLKSDKSVVYLNEESFQTSKIGGAMTYLFIEQKDKTLDKPGFVVLLDQEIEDIAAILSEKIMYGKFRWGLE